MSPRQLSEREARQLWARAAQLQEEARLKAAANPLLESGESQQATTGYALEHVREAAAEAGIESRYFDDAFDEVRAGVRVAGPGLDRQITRFLGPDDRVLEVSRVIRAPVAVVLEAIYTVFTSDQCKLILLDQAGGHPLDGGALIFKPAGYDYTTPVGSAVMWSSIRELIVRVRDVHGESTKVEIRCPMEYARKQNFAVGGILNGFLSLGGGAAAVSGAIALGGALPVVVGVGAIVGVASWFGGKRAYRAMYRYGLGKGQDGLQALLRQLAAYVETRSGGWERGEAKSLNPSASTGAAEGSSGPNPP